MAVSQPSPVTDTNTVRLKADPTDQPTADQPTTNLEPPTTNQLDRGCDHCRSSSARELNSERLDFVVHDARADAEQFRGVFLHPVRHLQRFHQCAALDLFERHA